MQNFTSWWLCVPSFVRNWLSKVKMKFVTQIPHLVPEEAEIAHVHKAIHETLEGYYRYAQTIFHVQLHFLVCVPIMFHWNIYKTKDAQTLHVIRKDCRLIGWFQHYNPECKTSIAGVYLYNHASNKIKLVLMFTFILYPTWIWFRVFLSFISAQKLPLKNRISTSI